MHYTIYLEFWLSLQNWNKVSPTFQHLLDLPRLMLNSLLLNFLLASLDFLLHPSPVNFNDQKSEKCIVNVRRTDKNIHLCEVQWHQFTDNTSQSSDSHMSQKQVSLYFYLTLIRGAVGRAVTFWKTSPSVSICSRKKRLMVTTCVLLTSFTSPSRGLHCNKRSQRSCMLPGWGVGGENQNTCRRTHTALKMTTGLFDGGLISLCNNTRDAHTAAFVSGWAASCSHFNLCELRGLFIFCN